MTSWKTFVATCIVAALSFGQANAQEHHTVTFENKCGSGTPLLKAGGKTLSSGQPFTSNGPLTSAISFLQKGSCGENGEGCTLVETTLTNPKPSQPGSGSSTDISLIPPHKFSVKSGFHYTNGCDGKGKVCDSQGCKTAFHQPNDTDVQVACQKPNVDLVITYC